MQMYLFLRKGRQLSAEAFTYFILGKDNILSGKDERDDQQSGKQRRCPDVYFHIHTVVKIIS
jgi:hypothetical protein